MKREIEITLSPRQAADRGGWKAAIAHAAKVAPYRIKHFEPLLKSTDARSAHVKVRLKVLAYVDEFPENKVAAVSTFLPEVGHKPPVIVAGAGPAGLFAALTLIKNGRKPIVIERGKEVKARKYDLAAINRNQAVNPDSNYCFGEGGAGTFSDGKLYTRSSKRGNVKDILGTFVAHGAVEEILWESHPHIGTDKLPAIVSSMRRSILEAGGEIHFNQCISDLLSQKGKFTGVHTRQGQEYQARGIILATGHSARDIYHLMQSKNLALEAKSFALGVRAEHPQSLIDSIQYHHTPRDPHLPAAAYNLVQQVDGRGVFSFCMCPGGIIVPSATGQHQIVVNGMSNSQRNSPFANSGLVVQVHPDDLGPFEKYGPLAGLYFQEAVEQECWKASAGSGKAPAQRLIDFAEGRHSADLPVTSYNPGVVSVRLDELLPSLVAISLQKALKQFNSQMKGYYTQEAVLLGTESRTSSPVRIPRKEDTLQHPMLHGLYPCGEGSGYSGGIVSSAMDGVRCALAASQIG